MKKLFLVIATFIALSSCNEADNKIESSNTAVSTNSTVADDNAAKIKTTDVSNITTIEWLDGIDRDLGKIKSGEKLDAVYRFKNTGTKPLIISDVRAGCGCTVAEKPTKPIAPGETSEIKAFFDSNNQGTGVKSKKVDVYANTNPEMTTLIFHVDIKPKS